MTEGLEIRQCNECGKDYAYSEIYELCPYCNEVAANKGDNLAIAIEGLTKISKGYLTLNGNPSGKLFSSSVCKEIADRCLQEIDK